MKTIIKSPYIIAKWKELATELGFSLENINDIHNSGNSEQDRCLNMLIKWTHKEKQNWLRSLARCVKRIGCKYVAGMLYWEFNYEINHGSQNVLEVLTWISG